MMKQFCFLVALSQVWSGVGTVKAEPVFIESRLTLTVAAQVVPDPVQWFVDDHLATGAYADLTASASISDSTTNGTTVAAASAQALWQSKAQGEVIFDNVGFVQVLLQESGLANVDNSIWYYKFRNRDDNEFAMDYTVAIGDSTDDIVGIQGFSFMVMSNGDIVYSEDLDLNTTGTIAVPLNPSQTYTVMIIPQGGFESGPSWGISWMWGDFSWSIHKVKHLTHTGRTRIQAAP